MPSTIGRVQPLAFEDMRLAEFHVRRVQTGVEMGRVFGDFGSLAIGAYAGHNEVTLKTGDPSLEDIPTENFTAFYCTAKYDSLDNYYLPKRGVLGEVRYTQYEERKQGSTDYLVGRVVAATTRDRNTLIFQGEVAYDDLITGSRFDNESFSGGFLRLSGYANNEIIAPRRVQRSLVYMRESRSLLNDRIRLYLGGSVEAGYFPLVGDSANIVFRSARRSRKHFRCCRNAFGPRFCWLRSNGYRSKFGVYRDGTSVLIF